MGTYTQNKQNHYKLTPKPGSRRKSERDAISRVQKIRHLGSCSTEDPDGEIKTRIEVARQYV